MSKTLTKSKEVESLCICSLKLKEHLCNPPPKASNATKMTQFNKGIGENKVLDCYIFVFEFIFLGVKS